MMTSTERAAHALIADTAFTPARPGFVGAEVDLPLARPGLAAAVQPLAHGLLRVRSPRLAVVSGPPSPGLDSALTRMAQDLARARDLLRDPAPIAPSAGSPATGGVRVNLEAGLDESGLLGIARRWALAHAVAPVLAAAFANSPLRDGRPAGWRSTRQAARRLAAPGADPRADWATRVLDLPVGDGRDLTFRAWARQRGAGNRPTAADLGAHVDAVRPPVAARGRLEIDVADGQAGDGWRVPVAVITALLDEPRAAVQALGATEALRGQPRLWERAARDGLTDPVLGRAARACFVAAYEGLARQGAARDTRDAVAVFIERYVMRGRCPADDVLASA